MRPSTDVSALAQPFRRQAEELLADVQREGLPLVVWEALRAHQRQAALYAQGRRGREGERPVTQARPGESAHEWGFAIDLVLDPTRIDVRKRAAKGKLWPDRWDNRTPAAVAVWERLGALARKHELEWGGSWRFKDLPHVQLPRWERYRPDDWLAQVRALPSCAVWWPQGA